MTSTFLSPVTASAALTLYTVATTSRPGCAELYDDGFGLISGEGDAALLAELSYARRSFGLGDLPSIPSPTTSKTTAPPRVETEYQSFPMLYAGWHKIDSGTWHGSGWWDGLIEGPTWAGFWVQNTYGVGLTSLPFMSDLDVRAAGKSFMWLLQQSANGTSKDYVGYTAEPGMGCEFVIPGAVNEYGSLACNDKQGDYYGPSDWMWAAVIGKVNLMAEYLLVTRNITGMEDFLPGMLLAFDRVEERRAVIKTVMTEAGASESSIPQNEGTAIMVGQSANLLAPSGSGWITNSSHVQANTFNAETAVSYAGALKKTIEIAKVFGNATLQETLEQRLDAIELDFFLTTDANGTYFVRTIDPNGTKHGVEGASQHGYFEATPNHDAIAYGVVNDTLSESIVNKILSMGGYIRPNVFILPNSDANGAYPELNKSNGKPLGVGYDDMWCGDGRSCNQYLYNFGEWVNGGAWTTTEGRWLKAAARAGHVQPAFESVRRMREGFADEWRMDNNLADFGLSPYQPNEPINTVLDSWASMGGLLNSIFEYRYAADSLTLVPHVPSNITALKQNFGVRWGPYRIYIETTGVAANGIETVTVDGKVVETSTSSSTSSHRVVNPADSSESPFPHVQLMFAAMPTADVVSVAADTSRYLTSSTRVNVSIVFKTQASPSSAAASDVSLEGMPTKTEFNDRARDARRVRLGETQAAFEEAQESAERTMACQDAKPLDCTAIINNAADNYTMQTADVALLEKFIELVDNASDSEQEKTLGLKDTVPYKMAIASAAYYHGALTRCAALNAKTLPCLRSAAANTASVAAMSIAAKHHLRGVIYQFLFTLPEVLERQQCAKDPNGGCDAVKTLTALWQKLNVPAV